MKTIVFGFSALCLLAACGDGSGAPAPGSSAKPAASGATSAMAAGSAAMSAAPAASDAPAASASAAAAPGEGSAQAIASGDAPPAGGAPTGGPALPADVQKLVDGLAGAEELKDPKLDGFFFMGPKGAKLDSPPVPGSWSEITADGATMSFFAHSPSDGGEGCPTMADTKKLVKDAKTTLDVSTKQKGWGKESLGDEIELWVFEKDGKTGFYGRKVFDKQDDDVTYCCAAGKPDDAAKMTGMLDKAKADVLAATCMGLKQKL